MVAANHNICCIILSCILLSASLAQAFMTISLPRASTNRHNHVVSSAAAAAKKSSSEAANGGGIRGVIFDIDGTLADSWNLGYQATLTVLTDYHNTNNKDDTPLTPTSYPLTSEEYHYGCRYTTPERLARHVGLDPDHPSFQEVGDTLGRQFDDYYVKLVDGKTAGFYDGIADLLIQLHLGNVRNENGSNDENNRENNGIKIGALTNACVEYAHAVLKANCPNHSSNNDKDNNTTNGVYHRFSSIHGANSVPRPKPFGDGILQCCSEMGLDPSEVIYVGDAPTDAKAAMDAKCRAAIGVLWGSNDEECLSKEEGFEVLCRDASDLKHAIRKYL